MDDPQTRKGHEFIGFSLADTPRSFLFQCHYWEEPQWMPTSQCQIIRDLDTFEIRVIASFWICNQKDIKEEKAR